MLLFVPAFNSVLAMYLSNPVLPASTTWNKERNAASAASLIGMTGSRTEAKIGGARREICGSTISLCWRLTVRMTTRARRLESMDWPG